MERKVRVRFAPSPTGALHLGGVRTALFNYLFARHYGGDFLLRIEDTDQTRYVPGAEEYIIESLKWCGLKVDEGVGVGGEYGPYRQSERKEIYKKYALQLVESGNAYYSFDTAEELDAMRKECEGRGETFIYNATSRGKLKNSLNMDAGKVKQLLEAGVHYVIRFKMPEHEDLLLHDIIRGEVHFNSSLLDDKVLYKSDGMPTYHLANIVDDHLMKITHVIRGEEWLPSLPLHVLLYKAFGWEDTMPRFAHLPLLLKPDGKGKLSKRDGDRLGFPVFPLEWHDPKTGEVSSGYRESGYLPEAVVNFLALLGWNPGNDQEIMSMDELIELFSLEKCSKSGAKFDYEKGKWFNHKYIQEKSNEELTELFMPILEEKGIKADKSTVARIIGLVKGRVSFVKELWDQAAFFFVAPTTYEEKSVKKRWKEETPAQMRELIEILRNMDDFSSAPAEKVVLGWIEQNGYHLGNVMNAFRLAVVGECKGPHMFDITEIMGKEETIKRIERAIEYLG